MIYREFLLYVLAPLIALAIAFFMLYAADRRPRRLVPIVVLAVVALVYTTPWDGWLIRNGVWSYPPGSVLGTVFDVPYEEYAFMVGQTVCTGLWTLTVLRSPSGVAAAWRRPVHCAAWLLVALTGGVLALTSVEATYLGSMAVWFAPLLALQAAVGADVLRAARPQRLAALSITGVLWVADSLAISEGAWVISPAHTFGPHVLGLPVEEICFFLTTNLLIVNSLILLASPVVRARLPKPKETSWDYARSAGGPTGS